jgi:ligand-binding SRPBCC domain-containing protein
MKLFKLNRRQVVGASLTEVFAFFSNPENLGRLTPPSLKFSILTPRPIVMQKGAQIDYKIRLFGVPMRWRTLISDYNPPHSFIDIQERGPYAVWEHTHKFKSVKGGTLIKDHVRYALPFGIIGYVMHSLAVRAQLRQIFDYRRCIIADLFG